MEFKAFLDEFKNQTGFDFCDYSDESLNRRLIKIQKETSLDYEGILSRVAVDEKFKQKIVEDITVNTTELFRDPDVWVGLYKKLYCSIPRNVTTAFWHIGCSIGLEVYSNLILLNELNMLDSVRVMATDLNSSVLETAKAGAYVYNKQFEDNFNKVFMELGKNVRFDKYFDRDKDTLKVKPFLTAVPKFKQQNLVSEDAPFPFKTDFVFLRNVMIYFNNKLQVKIMKMVYDKMYDGAYLILGKQERLPLNMSGRFEAIANLYRKNALNL